MIIFAFAYNQKHGEEIFNVFAALAVVYANIGDMFIIL